MDVIIGILLIFFIVKMIVGKSSSPTKRAIVGKYSFVSSVTDGNEQYFQRNTGNEPICHDCARILENPNLRGGYIVIGSFIYFMNDNTFVCHQCGPPYAYRRNTRGEIICSDCGGPGPFEFPADDSAVCHWCMGDRCID